MTTPPADVPTEVAAAAGIPDDHWSVAALRAAQPYGGAGLLAAAAAALHRRVAYLEALLGTHPDPVTPAPAQTTYDPAFISATGAAPLSLVPAEQNEPAQV